MAPSPKLKRRASSSDLKKKKSRIDKNRKLKRQNSDSAINYKRIEINRKLTVKNRSKKWFKNTNNLKSVSSKGRNNEYSSNVVRDGNDAKMLIKINDRNAVNAREWARDLSRVKEYDKDGEFVEADKVPGSMIIETADNNIAEISKLIRPFNDELNIENDAVVDLALDDIESTSEGHAFLFKATPSIQSIQRKLVENRNNITDADFNRINNAIDQLRQNEINYFQTDDVSRQGYLVEQLVLLGELDNRMGKMEEGGSLDEIYQSIVDKRETFTKELELIQDQQDRDDSADAGRIYDRVPPVIPPDPGIDPKRQQKIDDLEANPDDLQPPNPDVARRLRERRQRQARRQDDNDTTLEDEASDSDTIFGPAPTLDDDSVYDRVPSLSDERTDPIYDAVPPQPIPPQVYGPLPKPFKLDSIISTEAFKEANSKRGIRGGDYRRMVNRLKEYNAELDIFNKTQLSNKRVFEAPLNEKNEILDQRYKDETRRAILETSSRGIVLAIQKNATELNELQDLLQTEIDKRDVLRINSDNVQNEIKRLEDAIDKKKSSARELIKRVETTGKEIGVLTNKIYVANNELEIVDATLDRLVQAEKQIFQQALNRLNNKADALHQSADTYLKSKDQKSTNIDKLNAVSELINQVQNEQQNRFRLEQVAQRINGIVDKHRLAKGMRALPSDTASHVFKIETNGNIGDTNTNVGYAKITVKQGDPGNDTTANLGFEGRGQTLSRAPNLIARQVISSRLDKALDLNVLADEVFSKTPDGKTTIGITAEVSNAKEMMKRGKRGDAYRRFDLTDPVIQRGLSDLQVLDAITGQLDRHMGNIMIDSGNGQVKGIDNDMAFAIDSHIPVTPSTLEGVFTKVDGKLTFPFDKVHADTAQKIIDMDVNDFRRILEGQPDDPEKIESDTPAIQLAIERFTAVKEQMIKLKDEGRLLQEFDLGTYFDTYREGKGPQYGNLQTYTNYLTRAQDGYNQAGRKDNNNHQEE